MPEQTRETRTPYDPKQRLEETMQKLQDGVSDIFTSGRYEEYLSVMSRFHRYSVNNTMLIAMQRPDATYVAGYNAWQDKFGRHVNKGEKGIDIISPVKRKITVDQPVLDESGNPLHGPGGGQLVDKVEKTVTNFKVAKVFDISQTEGRDLPTLGVDELVGDVEHFDDVMAAITDAAPCPVTFEDIPGDSKGYFRFAEGDKHIAIQEGMSQAQTVKTALHELSHARMHNVTQMDDPAERPDQSTREVQAESCAYVVASHYGLDTSDYSFGYVAGWSDGRDTTELKQSLQQIKDCASGIIQDVDRNLEAIQQDRENAIAQAAFFIPEQGYLSMQRNADNQWDYTLYATDFQEMDGGVIEADMPISQAADEACALQGLDFDALDPVDAGDLADKVEQTANSPYMRSMTKAMPKDVSIVQKSTLKLRRPEHREHSHAHAAKEHKQHDHKHAHHEPER